MTSEKITERLQSADWCIICKTDHEVALVLNACLDAGVRWVSGGKPTEFIPFLPEGKPMVIAGSRDFPLMYIRHYIVEACERINITDWFFNEINK
jgi:hypothetical protein